ncbi:MAG: TIGR04551 family protein [Deltaproteobacteria bacterium]|nr:TIGR04551 family protein [Deltaproteobacteria bacterium]
MLKRLRKLLALFVMMSLFLLNATAFAQAEETDAATADEADGDEATEDEATEDEEEASDADAEDDDNDGENDGDGDDDDDDDDDGDEEKSKSADDLALDYAALGEMNPEEELSAAAANNGPAIAVSEDWTQRNLDIFEVHGYFRIRPGLYNKFFIRNDDSLFPLNTDRKAGCDDKDKCKTLAGADMRFLLAPTINLSEEVRIHSELIFFDNMMMGSTPSYSQDFSATTTATGSVMNSRQGGTSNDYFTMNRVWGEMEGPIGKLRFGRMPEHWGTGMLYNSGDGLNDDFGDSVDRISFAFKINGWTIMPAFDFPNEGLQLNSKAGRPFDVSQLDEGYRVVGVLAYQHEKEDQIAMLKRGDWLINTGLHFSYRSQSMDFHWTGTGDYPNDVPDDDVENQITAYDRDMWTVTPDLWFQFLVDTFHLELELALNVGEVGSANIAPQSSDAAKAMKILSWGGVLQIDYGLLSDQLRLGLEFGIASGDKDVYGLSAPESFDQREREDGSRDNKFSVFSFNPAFGVDNILYRHILGSVSGTYYFKPWLRYDFLNAAMGKKLGVQLDIVFVRAMYEESTIYERAANLGLEVDGRVDFVTADRFHASLKYGVLFPLNGFKGTYSWPNPNSSDDPLTKLDDELTIPQTLQLLLGITF